MSDCYFEMLPGPGVFSAKSIPICFVLFLMILSCYSKGTRKESLFSYLFLTDLTDGRRF